MSLKLNERYPGRFNNPSADYPDGSFKNRTAPAAKDGSYLEQDWANDREGFFQSLLATAGIEANGAVDKVGASQFFDALQKLKQSQSGIAFPTTGPSAALVLTPAPAITAYAAGQRFRVKFNRASTGADTINISAIGPKSLKQYDSTGAKIPAVFAVDQLSDVEYDGTDAVLIDQLPSTNTSGVRGSFSNLKQSATGLNASVSISADEISLESPGGIYFTAKSVALVASLSASGVNGLDTGASAANTWYSTWVISNGVGVAALLSLSSTSPTMPAGYTFKARTGWVRSDGTANKYPLAFTQGGRLCTYSPTASGNVPVWPSMSNGAQGSISASAYTPISVAISSYVPPTASRIIGRANASTTVLVLVGVSGEAVTYTGVQGTNPPQFSNAGYNTGTLGSIPFDILLKTTSIYWASSDTSSYLRCFGWEDNL